MKITVLSDWAVEDRTGQFPASIRLPVLMQVHPAMSFVANDGPGGSALCVCDCTTEQRNAIASDPRFAIVEEMP